MKFGWKRCLFLCMALLMCVPLAGAQERGALRIKAFKIGKADAYLLRTDKHNVLIDAGEVDDGEEIVAYLKKKDIT